MTSEREPTPIDDYASAVTLSRQLNASAPFKVRPAQSLLKFMKAQGNPMSAERDYRVKKVLYSGDDGGIMCVIRPTAKAEVIYASLTHLIIDPAHPLSDRVKTYQRQRTHQLKLQEEGGVSG